MKWFKLFISLILTAGIFYALNTKFGQIPPLGKFLSPNQGFWQNDVTTPILPVRHYMEMSQADLDRWEELLDMEADFPYAIIRELEETATNICCRWAREVGEED